MGYEELKKNLICILFLQLLPCHVNRYKSFYLSEPHFSSTCILNNFLKITEFFIIVQ